MAHENPNTVFYQIGNSPMGLVVVFSSRTTGKHFPAGTHIEDVPEGLLATVVHGVTNMPLVHSVHDGDEVAARQKLDAAGFVERPKDMSQAAQAPKRWSASASAAIKNAQRAPTGFVIATKMVGPKADTPVTVFDIHRANGPDPRDREWVPYESLPASLRAQTRRSHTHDLVFQGSEDEARAALLAAGLRDDGPYMLYSPDELSFGVMEDEDGLLPDGGTVLFILPKDEDSPYFDDLRAGHLRVHPDFIGVDDCENTWFIPKMQPDEVKAALVALGYTHDPELDGAVGG